MKVDFDELEKIALQWGNIDSTFGNMRLRDWLKENQSKWLIDDEEQLNEKEVYNTMLDAQEDIEKSSMIPIAMVQSHRKVIAKAICERFGKPKN